MSVLIKDMEMPKSCTWRDGRCPLLGDDDDCKLQDCQEEWTWQDQYKGCPLTDAPDTNVDTISRQAAIDAANRADYRGLTVEDVKKVTDEVVKELKKLPSAHTEIKPISYQDCSNAMLMMWMNNVITDGQYNRIMDKLNAKHMAERREE